MNLRTPYIAGGKRNLSLQIGVIDDVKIDDAQPPHACRGQIKAQRRAESAGANHEHLGLGELELPLHAHFGHDQVPAVTLDLLL